MGSVFNRFRSLISAIFGGPQVWAFIPALCLFAYWVFGETALVITALGLPLIWLIHKSIGNTSDARRPNAPHESLMPETRLHAALQSLFDKAQQDDRSAAFLICIDDAAEIQGKFSHEQIADIRDVLTARLRSVLRSNDLLAELTDMTWCIGLEAGPHCDLEASIQFSNRVLAAIEDPVLIASQRLYISASIGFALCPEPRKSRPKQVLMNAKSALEDALQVGPGAVRAYSGKPSTNRARKTKKQPNAMTQGKLVAWFQPQVCTDTGLVHGFEALARWDHPERGIIKPQDFLPSLEETGTLERLSEMMLIQCLQAIKHWDANGLDQIQVGLNVSEHDLSNPSFYDKVCWDLDRFSVTPNRLCIEILESVVASGSDDMIVRNVSRLADLGCLIDLDDFGTGHASISTLRRLPVSRLKIDRSFVAKADLDPEQQKMVATILMMAERLGLTTLAEGIETLGEHTMLAQLGCRYAQGFGIAKPMPLESTVEWVKTHQAKRAHTDEIMQLSRRKGL